MCELSHIRILVILLGQNHQPIGYYSILGILLVVCVSILQLELLLWLYLSSLVNHWYDLKLLMIYSFDFFSTFVHQLLFFLSFLLLRDQKLWLNCILEMLFLLFFVLFLDKGLLLLLRQSFYLFSYFLLLNLLLRHRAMLLKVFVNPSLIQLLVRLYIHLRISIVWARYNVLGIK